MAHKHIDNTMSVLKRKFKTDVDGTWSDAEVTAMLDSVQTSVVSAYGRTVHKTKRVSVEHFQDMLVKAVHAASPVSHDRYIIFEFGDGSPILKKLARGASFYIGRTAKADTDATLCHVFKHEVDTICRKVSTSHLNITNEGDGMKLRDTSSNGTWVNDEKIVKNVAIKLKDGDKVKLYNAKNEETVASAQFTVRLLRESND